MTTTDPTQPHICTADGADIIRDLRRQLVQEHEAAEWRQKCIDEAIAAIHDAPQEIAPLLPPVAPADLPRAVRALIDRARSQLVEAAEGRQRERDEARAALRQAEQERDEARREWRGLIDRIRTDASARGLDIEPGEDLVDGLLRIIDDRGKDRDDWQRQAEAADSLRAEVERHAGAQCGCDTNGECLARLYQQTRALVATAPETAPESPHTAEPAPEQAEASTDHLGDADGAVAYWHTEISEILAAWLDEEQRTGWQRLASDVAEQIIRDLDIADMAAERDRLRTEAAMLRAEREWLADRARTMGIAEAIIAAHGPAHAVSAEAGRLRAEVKRLSAERDQARSDVCGAAAEADDARRDIDNLRDGLVDALEMGHAIDDDDIIREARVCNHARAVLRAQREELRALAFLPSTDPDTARRIRDLLAVLAGELGDAGYDSHMRAALRAIDLLEAELRRIAADGEQVAEFAVPGAGLREEYRPSLPQTDELIELASAALDSTPDTGSTHG